MNLTNPANITSVVFMSQPTLDMLRSVPFYVCKRNEQPLNRPKIALTVLLLHHFTLSTWAVYVINLVGITSVGGLSQSILDMGWSEPFCVRKRIAQPFKHPKIDRTVLVLHR